MKEGRVVKREVGRMEGLENAMEEGKVVELGGKEEGPDVKRSMRIPKYIYIHSYIYIYLKVPM